MVLKSNRPKFESWGRYHVAGQVERLYWPSDFPRVGAGGTITRGWRIRGEPASTKMLPVGMGRSYGDVCLLANGTLLKTRGLDRFQSFDQESGILRCEAGVTLDEILELCVPRGWFLPVVPGTRYVTVGGAIANDVHGKNHHIAGTFGRYVRSLELARTDWFPVYLFALGERGVVSRDCWRDGIDWTIVSAQIQIPQDCFSRVHCQAFRFHGFDEFLALSAAHGAAEYSVGWMDSTATGQQFCTGHFSVGDHSDQPASA